MSVNGAGYCACTSGPSDQLLAVKAAGCLVDAHIIRVSLIVDPGVLSHILSNSRCWGNQKAQAGDDAKYRYHQKPGLPPFHMRNFISIEYKFDPDSILAAHSLLQPICCSPLYSLPCV